MHDSETAAEGQQVITACAFIHRTIGKQTEVFMAKRASTKKFLPNEYELPGGHIDFGEDIKEGLAREIQEELKIKVKIGDPFAVFTYMNKLKQSQSLEVIYFATYTKESSEIQINPADHAAFGWFRQGEIPSLTSKIKPITDDEFKAIQFGFNLLAGGKLDIGNSH